MNYKVEKIFPVQTNNEHKAAQVEKMFDDIAPQYDLLNRIMSLGIDKHWRKIGIKKLINKNPQKILDIATGTGDLAITANKLLNPKQIIGIDISEKMLQIAQKKINSLSLNQIISFEQQDSTDLQFPSISFDAVIVAFGVRNFENLDLGLQEILRVLQPNGCLMLLELATPTISPLKQLYKIYTKMIPMLGMLISHNVSAYKYLPKSISYFPTADEMKSILKTNGFRNVQYKGLTFGICSLYVCEK